MKVDETPTSIGGGKNKLVLVGVQSPSKIKPPADCRSAQKNYVMQSMTRTSQQVRQGVLEFKICTMYEYFDIFLGRMMMCRGAAELLGVTFKLTANGDKVL